MVISVNNHYTWLNRNLSNINLHFMNKSFLLLGAAILLGLSAHAQTSYGLKAGINLARFSNPEEDGEDFQTNNLSFHVTGFADIPLANQFSIQPGLSLQGKGDKYNIELSNSKGTASINLMSIELPVNFVYYVPAGPGKLFLGAGPYVGIHISGKAKTTGDVTITDQDGLATKSKKLHFTGDDREINLLDAGANFLLGYKLNNGLLVNAGYGLGLTKINAQGTKSSSRVINFGIGFQF